MKNVRSILKNERKRQNLTIGQVADQTKIPIKKLEALESGRYEEFDSEVYLKGFLRNYANFLKLEIDKVMAVYRRERGINEEQIISASDHGGEKPSFVLTPAKVTIFLVSFAIIVLITFVGIQINRIVRPPTLTLTLPVAVEAPSETNFETDLPVITFAGSIEAGSVLTINGNNVNTNNLQEFRLEDYALEPGPNKIIFEAENQFLKKNTITLTVVRTSQEDVEIQNVEETEEEQVQEFITSFDVVIQLNDEPAWIIVTVDGEQVLATVAQPGDVYEYAPSDFVTINTPRPQVVTITINGEEQTIPSNTDTTWSLINGEAVRAD